MFGLGRIGFPLPGLLPGFRLCPQAGFFLGHFYCLSKLLAETLAPLRQSLKPHDPQ
jgi:hypothetical protein